MLWAANQRREVNVPGKGRGPSFSACGDQYVAYAEKGDATLNASVTNAANADSAALAAELAAIRELLGQLQAPGAVEAVKQAEEEAVTPKPEKATVLSRLEQGVKIASAAEGFAAQSDKLIPRLKAIAAWAGHNWESWRPMLGL